MKEIVAGILQAGQRRPVKGRVIRFQGQDFSPEEKSVRRRHLDMLDNEDHHCRRLRPKL